MATQKTRAQLNADIDAKFPDNVNGEITPQRVRDFCKDLVESCFNRVNDTGNPIPVYYEETVSLVNGTLTVFHGLNIKPHAVHVVDSAGSPVQLSGNWKQTVGSEEVRVDLVHNAAVANCVVTVVGIKIV